MSEKVLLDTNAFDALLHGKFALTAETQILATPAQEAEIKVVQDETLRGNLLRLTAQVIFVPAGGFSFGVEGQGFGQAEWADDLYLGMLRQHPGGTVDRPGKLANRSRDVGTAWAALKHGAVLITRDRGLRRTMERFGGSVRGW